MKILLISPLPPPYGGIANWSKMILDYAKDIGDKFENINIAPKKRSTEGRNIFDRVVISGFDMLKKKRELRLKIKSFKPDVIHMTTSGSLAIIRDYILLKTAQKYDIPTVYHIHFGRTAEIAKACSKEWKLFSKAMELATSVIAIEKETYTAVKDLLPKINIELVSNPINTSELPVASNRRAKSIVFIGWVVPQKGIDELVKAWNTVGMEYPDYELMIIGQAKPEYLQILKSKVKVGNIKFVGELLHSDAMEVLSKSSVFVLPSYTEGCPYSVIEAMALKNTVVASSVGAIPEMLSDNCGIVIEPRNVDAIVNGLRIALSNREKSRELAENAFDKVTTNYSQEIIYDKYKEIWLNIGNWETD